MGLFSSSKTKVYIPPEITKARQFIENLYQQPAPEYPVAPVAGLSELEEQARERVKGYAATEPEGMDYLRSVLAESQDITEIPEYKALLNKVYEQGNLMVNRLGRSLQLRGAATSSTGRNVLGRTAEDIQGTALATLAPFAQAERGKKVSAAESLAGLSESATLSRINALSTTGALERNLKQLQETAEYEKIMRELDFPYTTQAQLALGLLNTPYETIVSGGESSMLEQLMPLFTSGLSAFSNIYSTKMLTDVLKEK